MRGRKGLVTDRTKQGVRSSSMVFSCVRMISSRSSSRHICAFHMRRQAAPIARLQVFQLRPAFTFQGLVIVIPWVKSKPLIGYMFHTLGHQRLALAAQPAAVLLLGVGTLTMAHTRGSPRLWASSVRTSAPRRSCRSWPAVAAARSRSMPDQQHGFQFPSLQHPMDPKAIEPGLLDGAETNG